MRIAHSLSEYSFQAHKNAENQETTTREDRVVTIYGLGWDGLFGFTRIDQAGIIDEVKEGWPAKTAGVRVGDEIVRIDGTSYFECSTEEVDTLFERARERRYVTLVLRYNPERLKELGYSPNP